ncbi:MAG: hypothetical protein IK083_00530 [Abditibacteriota bacterium]|nr:hypothetical protein [Abditibacteriota bacterium]
MRRFVLTLLLLVFAWGAFAQSGLPADLTRDLMPVSQIKRGMKGYGLTVFHGTKIERFDFEVRGILKEANSGGDLILVKLKHPLIDQRMSGVIQGMSGSPCYINGKLVGAVAYGRGWNKENTCMLTPIHDMLETLDPRLNESGAASGSRRVSDPARLQIPLSVSGLSPATRSMFADTFKGSGFVPVAGAGADTASLPDAKGASLQPGAAVGAVIITGDINAVGTGTVTWRSGNKLLAFGHPMDEIGPTSIPMCKAYVVDVYSGYEISHKYSVPLDIVGRIYQDRPYAIAGEINGVASMTPVNTHVRDRATGREKTIRCKVASGEYYFRDYAVMPVVETYIRVRPQQSGVNCRATYDFELADGEKYSFTNYYTSESDVAWQIMSEMTKVLSKVTQSKYGYKRLKSIDVDIELDSGNKYAYIERVFMNKKELKAGEDLEIGLVMRPYGSETTFTETKTLHVPDNLEDGNLSILVYGGALSDAIELAPTSRQGNNTLISVIDTQDNSTSFEQYLKKTMDFDKNNELVIRLIPATGDVLVVAGNKLRDMPPYMNQLFASVNNSVFTTEKLDYKTVFKTDEYIPMGAVVMSVPVKNNTGVSAKDVQGKPLSARILSPRDPESLFAGDRSGLLRLAGELDEALETVKKEQEAVKSGDKAEDKPGEKAEDKKPEDKKEEPKPQDKKPETTVSKRPSQLELKEGELAKGEFTGCSMGKDNAIYPTVERLSELQVPEQMATCSLQTEEGLYIGTGLAAGVYLKKEGEKLSKVCGLEDLWVTRLIKTSGGLYASTAPSGKVFRIEGREAVEAAAFDHKYISDVIPLAGGELMVGFADSDELCICSADFVKSRSLRHGGVYTTDFAAAPDGSVIIGTKKQLVRYTGSGLQVLMNDMGGSVNCVAVSPSGDVYAYVAGKNMIVKYNSGLTKIAEKIGDCFRAVSDETGNVYFAGRDQVIRIFPDGNWAVDEFRGAFQFSDIALSGQGRAYLSGVNPGGVYEIRLHPSECIYSTELIDLGTTVSLQEASAPAGGISWSVDKGDGRKPLEKNTPFGAGRICARFNESLQGSFNKITLSYFMANRAPSVKLKAPAFGQKLSGKTKMEWEVSDPDNDSWIPVITARKPGSEDRRVIYPAADGLPKADAKPETSREIDTAGLEDGRWLIELQVTDEPSNPEGAIAAVASAEALICNSEPLLEAAAAAENGKLSIKGKASCPTIGVIAGVQFSYDGLLWMSCRSPKGVFDTRETDFEASFALPEGATGEKTVKVRAVDDFGNSKDLELKVNLG